MTLPTYSFRKPFCSGPLNETRGVARREFLRMGLTGFASLGLAGIQNLRSLAAAKPPDTAIILVWPPWL